MGSTSWAALWACRSQGRHLTRGHVIRMASERGMCEWRPWAAAHTPLSPRSGLQAVTGHHLWGTRMAAGVPQAAVVTGGADPVEVAATGGAAAPAEVAAPAMGVA